MYRAVGNRCAVDLSSLPIGNDELALTILRNKGFEFVGADVVSMAKLCVGRSQYRLRAQMSAAPRTVDCSSFTKWLYGGLGIWLPRLALQQREAGKLVDATLMSAGDLIFRSGPNSYYEHDPTDDVGHVGVVTKKRTVIHAACSSAGVIESSVGMFLRPEVFRGVRRYVSNCTVTLRIPPHLEVETSDDIRFLLLSA
jgi:hypothetical protein